MAVELKPLTDLIQRRDRLAAELDRAVASLHARGAGRAAATPAETARSRAAAPKSRSKSRTGSGRNGTKLTAAKVRKIRKLAKDGLSDGEIAGKFGLSGTMIGNIRHGRSWAHVK